MAISGLTGAGRGGQVLDVRSTPHRPALVVSARPEAGLSQNSGNPPSQQLPASCGKAYSWMLPCLATLIPRDRFQPGLYTAEATIRTGSPRLSSLG